jgi:hypothetical protein
MAGNNCKACLYYLGHDLGSCRRFPAYVTRSQNEWCGEFAEACLPEVKPLGVFSSMGMDEPKLPTVKRGRPRK